MLRELKQLYQLEALQHRAIKVFEEYFLKNPHEYILSVCTQEYFTGEPAPKKFQLIITVFEPCLKDLIFKLPHLHTYEIYADDLLLSKFAFSPDERQGLDLIYKQIHEMGDLFYIACMEEMNSFDIDAEIKYYDWISKNKSYMIEYMTLNKKKNSQEFDYLIGKYNLINFNQIHT